MIKEKLLEYSQYFIDNEYLDLYCSLILDNLTTEYQKGKTEKHHIVQRKLYSLLNIKINNSKENLVNLSHFNHCLAHYYLCLCTTGTLKYSNQHSFMRMVHIKDRFEKFNFEEFLSKASEYDKIYKEFCENQSRLNYISCIKRKGGTIKGRHSYTNGEKNVFATECPEGFWPGRTVNVNKSEEVLNKMRESAKKRCSDPNYIEQLRKGVKKFYESHSGSATGKV